MQGRSFAQRAPADNVPIELDGVIHNAGKLPNNEIEISDANRPGLGSVLVGNFEDTLRNG